MNLGGPRERPLFFFRPASFMSDTIVSRYWRDSRAPRYSLIFALPLLLAYEALALTLSHGQLSGVRNGADVLLKSLFLLLGGRYGVAIFGVLLVGGGATLVWRDYRRARQIRGAYFGWMAVESLVYALLFGVVVGTLTALLLPGVPLAGEVARLVAGQSVSFSLPTQLMISLGAGIYEELLFRVVLVTGLVSLARVGFGWDPIRSNVFAVLLGALIFSLFHYIGPYGESLALGSFTFRAVAGLLLSGLYVLRGFGITAWTHALYDVLLAVGG
jgi:Type II CAAX prenyl endopeptidase Rce1-like